MLALLPEFQRQVGQVGHGSNVNPGVGYCQNELTPAIPEVVYQGDHVIGVVPVLQIAVQAGDSQLCASLFYFLGDVGSTLEEHIHAGTAGMSPV